MISTQPLHITLLSLLTLMAVVQAWYYFRFYLKAVRKRNAEIPECQNYEPLSVIICARNEASNLEKFLPSILEQDYPSFEVIVVNDCSEDNTFDVLGVLMKQYPNLKVSSIQKDPGFTHAKKLAMLIGIKAAVNDLLVFTDADCHPVSDQWLRIIAAHSAGKTDMVLGYGGYISDMGLLNLYIRHETMFTGMQYLGMTLSGVPYMGVGRNLSYRSSFFFARGGFGPFNHLLSGDDDLFVNRNATSSNCSAMLNAQSFTRSLAPVSFNEWVRQKHRHLSTSKYYRFSDKFRLFAEPFSRVSYYGLLITLLIMLVSWPVVAGLAAFRLILRALIIRKASRTFNEPRLWFFSLFFDILSPFVTFALFVTRTRKGKGRSSWK